MNSRPMVLFLSYFENANDYRNHPQFYNDLRYICTMHTLITKLRILFVFVLTHGIFKINFCTPVSFHRLFLTITCKTLRTETVLTLHLTTFIGHPEIDYYFT